MNPKSNPEFSRDLLKASIEKIGGPDALERVLNDFYKTLSLDILVGFFFTGKDLTKIAHQQAHFILKSVGLGQYKGLHPKDAHLKIAPILKGHFDRRLRVLEDHLRKTGLSEDEIRNWVGFENAFRNVVETKI